MNVAPQPLRPAFGFASSVDLKGDAGRKRVGRDFANAKRNLDGLEPRAPLERARSDRLQQLRQLNRSERSTASKRFRTNRDRSLTQFNLAQKLAVGEGAFADALESARRSNFGQARTGRERIGGDFRNVDSFDNVGYRQRNDVRVFNAFNDDAVAACANAVPEEFHSGIARLLARLISNAIAVPQQEIEKERANPNEDGGRDDRHKKS